MKKGLAIFLSAYIYCGSFFPGNSYSEFLAMPALIKHLEHHRALESPLISLFDFTMMHYANYKHVKSDPVNHRALPAHHNITSIIFVEITPLVAVINALPVKISDLAKRQYYNEPFIALNLADSIFHPPKV